MYNNYDRGEIIRWEHGGKDPTPDQIISMYIKGYIPRHEIYLLVIQKYIKTCRNRNNCHSIYCNHSNSN